MKQVHIFFAALMFLTRLPIPKWVQHKDAYLQQCSKYYTLVGMLVGLLVSVAYLLTTAVLDNTVAIIISMGVGILITGAFHEDGFADCCDAFGGGYTKDKVLEIMKDSRLGTYGVVGLCMMLLLKFTLLAQLSTIIVTHTYSIVTIPYKAYFPLIIILAHSTSRLMPLLVLQYSTYVYQHNASKSKPMASNKPGWRSICIATIIALLPCILLPYTILICLLPMCMVTYWYTQYSTQRIGGYTGDCLGAIQQVTELVCYAFIIIILKYS